jgi:hypothetical protein
MVFASSWLFTIGNQKALSGVNMSNLGNYLITDIEEAPAVKSPIVDSEKAPGTTPAVEDETTTNAKKSEENVNPSNNDKEQSLPTKEESIKKPEETNQESPPKEKDSEIAISTNSSTNVKFKVEPQGKTRCGCPLCDEVSLHQEYKAMKCEQRIDFLMERYKTTEDEACSAASAPGNILAPCGQECNPAVCQDMTEKPKPFKPDLSNITDSHEPFTRHDGVAIVTKTYSLQDNGEKELKRMICLMNAAYNRHVNYDFVIFIAMPFSKSQEVELQQHAYPAKLTLVQEPTLEEHLANMTKEETDFLFKRCNVTDGENISWMHYCTEKDSYHTNNLAYSWQAEFRAAHIYKHPALRDHKYMIWLDTDSWIMRDWDKDPIQAMVDNDLVILFDAFNYGRTSNPKLKEKMEYAYDKAICSASLNEEKGHLEAQMCEGDASPIISQVGGFNHITNLDVYRKDIHQKFLLNMVGEYKFARQWDDQLGVTVPALYESPERSWDARRNGFNFGIVHHFKIDAAEPMTVDDRPRKDINAYWTFAASKEFDAGRLMCDNLFDESK